MDITKLNRILNKIAQDNGLSNVPIIVLRDFGPRGQYSHSMNTIFINAKQNTFVSIVLVLAHELFHANDSIFDGKNLRELRANIFMMQYSKNYGTL